MSARRPNQNVWKAITYNSPEVMIALLILLILVFIWTSIYQMGATYSGQMGNPKALDVYGFWGPILAVVEFFGHGSSLASGRAWLVSWIVQVISVVCYVGFYHIWHVAGANSPVGDLRYEDLNLFERIRIFVVTYGPVVVVVVNTVFDVFFGSPQGVASSLFYALIIMVGQVTSANLIPACVRAITVGFRAKRQPRFAPQPGQQPGQQTRQFPLGAGNHGN